MVPARENRAVLGGPVLLALLTAEVAPAATVGNVAELLHVDVQHRPGVVVLVATNRLSSGTVDVRQAVQVDVDQDPVDCRRSNANPVCQLNRTFPQTQPELDTALRSRGAGLVRGAVRP